MSNNADIQDMMTDVERIFEAAHTTIQAMNPGCRKQIKELAQDVSTAVGMDPKDVLAFVNHYAHRTKIAYVTRGKNGGIIKGTRPVKVVKVKKTPDSDTINTPSDTQ